MRVRKTRARLKKRGANKAASRSLERRLIFLPITDSFAHLFLHHQSHLCFYIFRLEIKEIRPWSNTAQSN